MTEQARQKGCLPLPQLIVANPIDFATAGRVFGLFVTVALPSLVLHKTIGAVPLVAWLFACAAGTWLLALILVPRFSLRQPSKEPWIALAVLLVGIAAAYLLIHPFIDTDGFWLLGRQFGSSDADDAIDVALERLLAGQYPYRIRTFLDNPITPLPGTLLLSLPFHLAGDSGLQNLFWLALLFGWVAKVRDPATSMWLALGAMVLCPVLGYQVLQGTDYVANAIYVWFASVLLLRSVAANAPTAHRVFCSCLLGVALSSRLNFMITTPLLFLALSELRGWRVALLAVLPSALTFACLTIPFYLIDPGGFSPLHTARKLDPAGSLPWLVVVVPALGLAASFVLGVRPGASELATWSRNTFVVQLFLVLAAMAGAALGSGEVALMHGHFAVLALPFGLIAFGAASLSATSAVPILAEGPLEREPREKRYGWK